MKFSTGMHLHLGVAGLLCYAHNQGAKRDKFVSSKSKMCFYGYPYGKKGWILYNLETQNFFSFRDVEFCASKFHLL